MEDTLKRLESLEKRLKELESKQRNDLQLFGRNYTQIGSSSSDVLIKTKGQVKLQWGNKFIDLIKDGKINCDYKFIYNEEPSAKEGLYVTDDNSVYLKVGDLPPINLVGEIGNTYVSFIGEQETTSDAKYNALKNIGFLYPSLELVNESALRNGIVYIESEKKLYIIQDGILDEFNFQMPNPFKEQFIISKDNASIGSILIKGSGISNSIAFDSLYIFTEEGTSYIQSGGEISISINEKTSINITRNKTIIKNIVESNTFQSIGADTSSGFTLSMEDGRSTLVVDKLIVRYPESTTSITTFPTVWSLENNIITKVEEVTNSEDEESDVNEDYILSLLFENKYKVGDCIYIYGTVEINESILKLVKVPAIITGSGIEDEAENTISIKVLEDLLEESISDILIREGYTTFLVGSDEKLQLIRQSQHNIDLIECQTIEEEMSIDSIKSRIGILDELNLKEKEVNIEKDITGTGIYSKYGYFGRASYTTEEALSENDNSTRFASTEWTKRILKNILPVGTIIAYHGDNIPEGWAICDGTNGTPDLIGKFIVANTFEEDGDEIEITPLDTQVGEDLLRVKISPTYYSLIFIMKIQ